MGLYKVNEIYQVCMNHIDKNNQNVCVSLCFKMLKLKLPEF